MGGWSGDSTYGVRVYTPDGAPGVPGRNDWQENVDVLRLQDGRWYPSAMVMANGSVLVVGGEVGSNGAPVPTLEILPPTGSKPQRMDWLERTDPNNLYPFMAILPSGGILAVYWNEARILDERTFATVKTLPNLPGAVNNPQAGRAYPLEGAAVLLPQRAPYQELLGVLICGGSTSGASTALDNCVSTYPDAPNPEWTLERMPSRRVLPCMAPLPDGTYLIANGAHHGVAGFGLAKDPNLNALLYDPAKPVGRRISVMANTTVARMYHSEAITLLDGRVLVSGSDPQDGVNPEEYRVETFTPPYLLRGKPRPTFELGSTDWKHGQQFPFRLGAAARNGDIAVSLLGSVSSTHGNSMGARTIFPRLVHRHLLHRHVPAEQAHLPAGLVPVLRLGRRHPRRRRLRPRRRRPGRGRQLAQGRRLHQARSLTGDDGLFLFPPPVSGLFVHEISNSALEEDVRVRGRGHAARSLPGEPMILTYMCLGKGSEAGRSKAHHGGFYYGMIVDGRVIWIVRYALQGWPARGESPAEPHLVGRCGSALQSRGTFSTLPMHDATSQSQVCFF